MDYLYLLLILITIYLSVYYRLMFRKFKMGWMDLDRKEKLDKETIIEDFSSFSILIPCRNEALNISACLDSFITQNYPLPNFEIIVIDDYSTDGTKEIVREFITRYGNISMIELKDFNGQYSLKKGAIECGIRHSKFENIITTDADCVRGEDYLLELNKFLLTNENTRFISAPVRFIEENSFFSKFMGFEFLGLNAMGGASIQNKMPNMCNGANLCYKKSTFMEVGGYEGNKDMASGDDEFLMHKIFEKFPEGVRFLKLEKAMVETPAPNSISDFLKQRKRWVSKSTKYKDKRITRQLLTVWLFCFLQIVMIPFVFSFPYFIPLLIFMMFSKLVAEYKFYAIVLPFYKKNHFLKIIFQSSVLHTIYVAFIAFYANIGGYEWKGRKLK